MKKGFFFLLFFLRFESSSILQLLKILVVQVIYRLKRLYYLNISKLTKKLSRKSLKEHNLVGVERAGGSSSRSVVRKIGHHAPFGNSDNIEFIF